uniref:Single-stranded DNA-binding protein 3 n=1 Tax=Plectus sambesii TaxID=2011161 RepID=A0A914WDM9_9BILA
MFFTQEEVLSMQRKQEQSKTAIFESTAPSPIGMPPGADGMPPGAMGPGGHPGFFPPRPSQPGPMPPASQASPISGHPPPGQPVGFPGGPRFGPRGGPSMGPQRLPQDPNMFGPGMYVAGGHPDQLRPPAATMPMHPQRLPPSAGPMRGANNYSAGMRPNLAPPMPRHWQQSTSGQMHFTDPSGGQYPPGGPMMSNGPMSIPCSSAPIMSSPGPMPIGGPDGGPLDPRYIPMSSGVPPGMAPFSMSGVDCVGPGGAPSEMLMNGEDIKNSPASTHGGLNGGTPGPGSQQNNGPHGGPGSAAPGGPGSVHSQGNNGNDSMDYSTGGNQPPHGDDEQSEIAKIKQDMIQGYEPKTDFHFDTI